MRLLALLFLVLVGAAAPGQPDQLLRRQTYDATFTGWERGDYVWARFEVGRRRLTAMPGDDPIGPFLEANRGRRITVTITTVRTDLPEAGRTEIRRVVAARRGGVTADGWWSRLSPRYRRAWTRRFEEAIG